jgi:hypothetical protein
MVGERLILGGHAATHWGGCTEPRIPLPEGIVRSENPKLLKDLTFSSLAITMAQCTCAPFEARL